VTDSITVARGITQKMKNKELKTLKDLEEQQGSAKIVGSYVLRQEAIKLIKNRREQQWMVEEDDFMNFMNITEENLK